MSRHIRVAAVAVALFVLGAGRLSAEAFRDTVVVARPDGMPRRAAEMAMDALAKEGLLERFISSRMSPALLHSRTDEIKAAFEPIESVMQDFNVLNREDVDGTRTRVTCEADVDLAAVLLRLVSARVLTFSEDPPRILLLPTANTSLNGMQAVRSRLGSTLGNAGFTLLAAEAAASASITKLRMTPTEWAAMTRQVSETRADLIALIDLTSSQVPSPVGGVILDAVLQYTVVRPRDNAIVAERVFTSRSSGTNQALAEQAVLSDLGPQMGKALAGKLAETIFASGEVVDGNGALPHSVTLNVFFRPSAASTASLMDLIRAKGAKVELGTSSMATIEAEIRNRVGDPGFAARKVTPADRLIVSGDTSLEQLFDLLATEKFGPQKALRASVIEYGDNYIGLEIVEPSAAPRAPIVSGRSARPTGQPVALAAGPADGARPGAVRPPLKFKKKLH